MKIRALLLLIISMSYCSNAGPTITPDTLATINDRTISKDNFATQTQSIASTPNVDLATNDGRINVLKDMINEELVFQQALNEQFHLKNLDIKHEVVREFLKEKFSKDIPQITDKQIKDVYDQHKEDFDQIRARHILFIFDKDNKKSKSDALELAKKVRQQIIDKKITFEDAVTQYSHDTTSKLAAGDLSYFPKNGMVEPFGATAFALEKIGDLSNVIETQYGYHIIQLTSTRIGIDANKENIKWKLSQDMMQPKIDAYFKELRDKSKIKIVNGDLMPINVPQS